MTSEEIKQEKERCFKDIKEAKESLKKIREICQHEKTFVGLYEARENSGARPAVICEYCGKCIRYKD